jgi:hypothetical protein
VEETKTNGENHACYGDAYDKVCVWYKTLHTAYTVRNFEAPINDGISFCPALSEEDLDYSEPFVMASPNVDNVNGGFYCVLGDDCGLSGANFWRDYGTEMVVMIANEVSQEVTKVEESLAQQSSAPERRHL